MNLYNLSIEEVRKLFCSGKISRENYWLYLQSRLSILDDVKCSLFQAIKSIDIDQDDLTLSFNFYEDYLVKLVIDFHDIRSAANTIFANGEYETTQMKIICQLAKQNDYFMDIGSNVGLYAICASLVNPNIKVASFEPNVKIAKQQKRNLEINNIDSVRIFDFGLANEDSDLVNFFIPSFTGSGGGGLLNLHPEEGPSENTQVAIKMLDNLEKDIRSQVDFIKVDIEGAEFEFLKGSLNTISDSKPVIISELLRKWMLPFGSQPQDFVTTLLEMGYVCFEIEDLGIKRTTNINELTISNNFVFVHKNDSKNLRIIADFEFEN